MIDKSICQVVPCRCNSKDCFYKLQWKEASSPKWWYKIKESSCQVNQYFFGGHLIDEVKTDVGEVESEKTATIMSIYQPN
ncbi:MAG: DUF6371 domain-containing protein, partial [Flavobacteriaceae bacterium]